MDEIQNEELRLQVSKHGAEIQSLTDKTSGREYMWQGDKQYWGRRSPVLFPIVGGMWNGETRFGNQIYKIAKHGFLQDREFELTEQTSHRLCYTCSATEEDKKVFPFDYTLSVVYSLTGRKVLVEYIVTNNDKEVMYFQVGGHPGFNLPDYKKEEQIHGYVRFEGHPESLLRAGDQGCIEPRRLPYKGTDAEGFLPIQEGLFAHDALIFDNNQVEAITLADAAKKPYVRVTTQSAVTLMWAPDGKNAPFVCVEPWYGLCDHQGFDGPFSERPYVNSAEPGKQWGNGFEIEIL